MGGQGSSPGSTPGGASWGRPLVGFDRRWTQLEAVLCASVLVAEVLLLCAWIALKGLSTAVTEHSKAGLVFRLVLGALAAGVLVRLVTRGRPERLRTGLTLGAAALGGAVGALVRNVGVEYFANLLTWLQDASTLTLVGGLRGLGTRLTLWLALLGASLASSRGKHISIDVSVRFLSPRLRLPVAVAGWLCAALVCATAAWGFFDHIAIDSFGQRADAAAVEKLTAVPKKVRKHLFALRKQLALDLKSLPKVLAGERYDQYLGPSDWNSWVRQAGFEAHYSPDEVAALLVPTTSEVARPPLVAVPSEAARGLLVHDLNLVVPFGLLMIALRFLLRVLLAVSGHVSVDPDAAHADEGRPANDEVKA